MKKTMLLAVLMMLGLAAGAFAQATFQGATENVTLVVDSGHTELTGDVRLEVVQGTTAAGQITLKYNVPFTSPLNGDTGTPTLTSNLFPLGAPAGVYIDQNASDGPAGTLVLTIPAGVSSPAEPAAPAVITIHGVRLDVAGSPKPAYTVTLSVTKNFILNGQFTAPVIDGAAPGLKADTKKTEPVTVNAVSKVITPLDQEGVATIVLKEGFNNAFGLAHDPSATISQMIRIRLSAAPPEGVTITFPLHVGTNVALGTAGWTLASSSGTLRTADYVVDFESTGTELDVYYRLTSDNNPVLPENIVIPAEVEVADDADVPLPAVAITFTATLAPVQPAFDADGEVTDLPIPRYAESLIDGGDFVIVQGSSTALVMSLAQWMDPLNTGIAIANTTADPGKAKLGVDTAAVKQTGKLTFYMWNQQVGATAPKLITYTTGPDSPGTGLDANGNLPAGSTYTVNLSQILEAAGATGDFQGYIIIVANFTNAHGQHVSFIMTEAQNFSWGEPMNVIGKDRTIVPESLGQ